MTLFFTLSRYFARTFFLWFTIFTMGIITVILVFDFSETIRRAAAKPEITVDIVTEMVLLQAPSLVEQLLPFIVLFSAMFVLWKFNKQNEICIVRATGLSVWKFLSPLIFAAFLIGCFDLLVWNPLSSTMLTRYKAMNAEYFRNEKSGISIAETGIWLRHAGKQGPVVYRIGRISPNGKNLYDLSILEYSPNNTLKSRITATKAEFTQGGLNLYDFWTYPVNEDPSSHAKGFYETTFDLSSLQKNKLPPESISFWALPQFIKLLDKSGLSSVKYRLHFQAMFAQAIWLIAMVLLAATCTLRPLRSGRQFLFILPATAMGFSLYLLRDITYAMGQSSTLPVFFAAWSPVAISAMIAIVTLLHTEEH